MAKKQEASAVAVPTKGEQSITTTFGESLQGFDPSDLLIPKILIMQGLSELVVDDKASMGEIVNSVTGEKLAAKGGSVDICPLISFKTWTLFRNGDYEKTIPMDSSNRELPWDDKDPENGDEIRRDQTLNFYVLVPSEIETGMAFPYLISFRRMSYNTGKKLATHFVKAAMVKKKPYDFVLSLSAKMEKNDKGSFYVPDVATNGASDASVKEAAMMWLPLLRTNKYRVDDSDLKGAEKVVEPTTAVEPETHQY